jgi:serine/threonine-protein kinase HipA
MKMDNGSNTLSLDAFIGQSTKVGTLWVKRDDVLTLHFEYDEKWMETGFPLSPHLPFGQQITSSAIKNYLENLFPEGRGFEMMLENTTISRHNIFALTEKVGHDTAGAIEFRPTGAQLTPTNYRVISDAELNSRVEQLVNFNRSIADWDGKTRLSVAGVQVDILLAVNDEDSYCG